MGQDQVGSRNSKDMELSIIARVNRPEDLPKIRDSIAAAALGVDVGIT